MTPKEKDTKFYIKDRGEGGAMPDTVAELDDAVETRRRINEKALEGKVNLKYAEPEVFSGDVVVLKGLGPRFSGQYVVEKHVLEWKTGSLFTSVLTVSRNAVGDTSGGGDGDGDIPSPSDEALEGVEEIGTIAVPGLTEEELIEYAPEEGMLPERFLEQEEE